MSDKTSADSQSCNVKARLPDKIHAIQVTYTKDECYLHSITFEGDSVLTIGGFHDYGFND